jgi:hypothetical protein
MAVCDFLIPSHRFRPTPKKTPYRFLGLGVGLQLQKTVCCRVTHPKQCCVLVLYPHYVIGWPIFTFLTASIEANRPDKKGCECYAGDGFLHGAFENSTNNRTGQKLGIAQMEKLVKFVVLCCIHCSAFVTISSLACLLFGWPSST